MKELLDSEVQRFNYMYPRSCVRFAEIIGRRVSHITGCDDELHVQEQRVPVNQRIVMFVENREDISDAELERFAVQVAAMIGDTA